MKTFATVVTAILTAVFVLYGLVVARIKWNERQAERQIAETQRRADLWCQNHNHDSGGRYYGNPQFLCAASNGAWSSNQPDGQLISDNGYLYMGDAVDRRMREEAQQKAERAKEWAEAKKEGQTKADAWCQQNNGNDPNLHYNQSHGDGSCEYPDGSNPAYGAFQPSRALLSDEGEVPYPLGIQASPEDCVEVMHSRYYSLSLKELGCPNTGTKRKK